MRKLGHVAVSETFITKAAAERCARETQVKLEHASFVDQGNAQNTTVKDLLGEYENKITPRKRSWRREKSRLKGLVARLGRYSLAELTAQAVVDFVDARATAGAGGDTIRKDLNTLSHAIDTGIALWGIPLPFNSVVTARKILLLSNLSWEASASSSRHSDGQPSVALEGNGQHERRSMSALAGDPRS